MRQTGQDNPTAGDRRRTPGVGQTVAIAGSIAAVLAGMFGLAAAEDDNPDLAPYRIAALRAVAPVVGAPPAAVGARSDVRPYPAPAPFAAPSACRPALLLAAGSTQAAPSHGLSMITPAHGAAARAGDGRSPDRRRARDACGPTVRRFDRRRHDPRPDRAPPRSAREVSPGPEGRRPPRRETPRRPTPGASKALILGERPAAPAARAEAGYLLGAVGTTRTGYGPGVGCHRSPSEVIRYVVCGAGAIGGVVAAKLALAGLDVTLLARGANYERIRTVGARLRTPTEDVVVEVPTVAAVRQLRPRPDVVVLLAVKSQDTFGLAQELVHILGADCPVACLQNGVDNERTVARFFDNVYATSVMAPNAHPRPGEFEAYAAPVVGVLEHGRYCGGSDARWQRWRPTWRVGFAPGGARRDGGQIREAAEESRQRRRRLIGGPAARGGR